MPGTGKSITTRVCVCVCVCAGDSCDAFQTVVKHALGARAVLVKEPLDTQSGKGIKHAKRRKNRWKRWNAKEWHDTERRPSQRHLTPRRKKAGNPCERENTQMRLINRWRMSRSPKSFTSHWRFGSFFSLLLRGSERPDERLRRDNLL